MDIRNSVLACMAFAVLAGWAMEASAADDVTHGAVPPIDDDRGQVQVRPPDRARPPIQGAVVGRRPIPRASIPLDELMNIATRHRPGDVHDVELPFAGDDEQGGSGNGLRVRLHTVSEAGDNRFVLSGHSVARRDDLVVLVVSQDRLGGRLTIDDRHYLIRKIGNEHYLMELDPGLLPPPAPPTLPKPSTAPGTQHNPPPHSHPGGICNLNVDRVLSVLVLYTQAARVGAAKAAAYPPGSTIDWTDVDGDEVIREDVLSALGAANVALHNSPARTRFGISIQAEPVQYFETGDGDQALDHLYTAGHPLHIAATTLRKRQGQEANLVTLIIEHWPEACGVAPVMVDWDTHPDQTAFSVVRRSCLEGEHFSLAHELGHSIGSAHDHAYAGVPGLFAFSYGYVGYDVALSSVMAYRCKGCKRLPVYSNPGASTLGSGIQSGDFDNARSIDRAACKVVNWK